MTKIITLSLFLFSLQLHAACKCNCNPADMRICASSYDLDHPCGSLCSTAAGVAPMLTACPLIETTNPLTGLNMWIVNCSDQ